MKTAPFNFFCLRLDQNDVVLTRQKSKRRRLIVSAVLIVFPPGSKRHRFVQAEIKTTSF